MKQLWLSDSGAQKPMGDKQNMMIECGHESGATITSFDSSFSSFGSLDDDRIQTISPPSSSHLKPGVLFSEEYAYGDAIQPPEEETSRTQPAIEACYPCRSNEDADFANPCCYGEDAESGSSMETSRMERRSSMKQGGRRVRRASITYRDEITNTLPSGKTVQRRRSVGFDALAEVSHLEPTMNLVDNSKELWFQRNEFHMIRERARSLTNLAKSIREGNLSPSAAPKITSRTCLRGLESFIDSDFVKYEQHEAWKSVFIEQDHQKTACNFDEEIVAYHYGIASMPATARALKRAQGDVVDAEKHTRTILRRHSSL